MGAATQVYVQVLVRRSEWREVSAISRDQAEEMALGMPDVLYVIRTSYDKPAELDTEAV